MVNDLQTQNRTKMSSTDAFWCLEIETLLNCVQSRKAGLTQKEARERLVQFGRNTVVEWRRTWLLIRLAKRFTEPLVAILVIAAAISGAAGDLASFAIILSVVILSIVLGMYAAWRRDRAADRIIFGASVVGNAVPDFLVGAFLVFALATYWLHWLPAVATISPGELPSTAPKALVMPCLTMIIPGTAYLSRLVRAGFIDILDSPYIRMAMLKGIRPRAVLFRHALPNALSAAVPAFSLVAAIMMGAVVVVEFLFNYPGVGGTLLTSITTRDLPMLQAAGLLIGVVVYLLNLLADVLSRRFSV